MSSSEVLAGPDIAVWAEAAWQEIQQIPELRASIDEVQTESSFGSVVLLVNGQKPAAIKVRGDNEYADMSLEKEAAFLAMLDGSSASSPLHIPRLLEGRTDGPFPHYVAMERAHGSVLSRSEVYQLSPTEKQALGREVGAFAAWMAQTIDVDDYFRTLENFSSTVYDRAIRVRDFIDMLPALRAAGCHRLAAVLLSVADELGDYLRPPEASLFIGHDDIRATNMSFEYDEVLGVWKPASIFDFELMKPLTADREFRHLRLIGELASQAAAEVFYAKTGQIVLQEEIDFWASYQAATAMTVAVAGLVTNASTARTDSSRSMLASNYRGMHEMFPNEDWSELDRFVV
jgi:hypothetical protein